MKRILITIILTILLILTTKSSGISKAYCEVTETNDSNGNQVTTDWSTMKTTYSYTDSNGNKTTN